ncbi:MAG: hypothetical protein JJU05_07335 [Verrucomicrobia bacterium]|nr:hypothetical protein [Verrucomicrobiota bacterium]MCH8526110.1 hypothetical protein [Kiritimatiellia bacterium]
MRVKPPLIFLVCTLLLASSGCSTPSTARPAPATRTRTAGSAPLRTEFLMLNIAEASGWVAFTDSTTDAEDTEDYRIVIQRESTGEILFESSIPLARGLRTHGFEMSREDARLIDIASTVDAGILPPLSQLQTPPVTAPETPAAPSTEETLSVLTGVQVIDATQTGLILQMEHPDVLKLGGRLFLRTPPETMQDPDTGDTIILSRGRIAGLLEITQLSENRATATLKSGEIPPEGYLERVDPEL